ncbi:MAG: hypothetical protein J7L47_05645 [Candidatus Odinarchaeota archaeon]|nr:hypothetical protein [Candidatus Odinarchaeota archaeon]
METTKPVYKIFSKMTNFIDYLKREQIKEVFYTIAVKVLSFGISAKIYIIYSAQANDSVVSLIEEYNTIRPENVLNANYGENAYVTLNNLIARAREEAEKRALRFLVDYGFRPYQGQVTLKTPMELLGVQ